MHLLSIPRHRIETTLHEYVRILASLVGPAERPDAVAAFEQAFADYIGCRHAIAVSSGRLGMHLILERLGLEAGDEAIVPSFNLFAVIERFRQLGLTPRFCDIDRASLNIDPAAAEALITPRTRLLLVTHMYGHAANMSALRALADRHNLTIIEDCAHALGTTHGARCVGNLGKAAIFSFSVLKLITTFGGGMVTTNDDDLATAIREDLSRLHHQRPRPVGLKRAITGTIMDLATRKAVFSFGAWPALRLLRAVKPRIQQQMMTETPHRVDDFDPRTVPHMHAFQARLGLSQLARTNELIEKRRRVSQWLDEALAAIPQIQTLARDAHGRHNGLYYGILAPDPEALSAFLFRRGIDSETSEYRNCADLDIYRELGSDCPIARDVQSRILRLPNYPGLSKRDVARIATAIQVFYR